MSSGNGWWLAALLVAVTPTQVVRAQSIDDYLLLLDTYALNHTQAVAAITAATVRKEAIEDNVRACLPRLVQFAGDVSPCRGLPRSLAVALHTEAAVRTDTVDDPLALFHLQQAMRLVGHLGQPAVIEKWHEFAVMFMLSRGSVRAAASLADDMADRFPKSAVPHYLRGVVKEVGVMFDYKNLRDPIPSGRAGAYVGRTLERAASDYERALRQDPTLVNARLHWGRIRSLLRQPDGDGALAAVAGEAPGSAIRYLANLFLGSSAERRGQLDAALRHYEVARGLQPRAQTACLAISHLLHVRGDSERATTVARECVDTAGDDDPWWSYRVGAYGAETVNELRALAMRP